MPYTADKPPLPETVEQLRARIPGWGADLDPADRPAVPRERLDRRGTGAHWDVPEQQPELRPRERSIEHARLTPVFGTTYPPRGLSGALRRLAYRRWSEGRAAHWLVLLAADRVDAQESHLRSLVTSRPDDPLTQSGALSELSHHPLSFRFGRGRADAGHHLLDPVLVGGPWVAAAVLAVLGTRRLVASRRR